MIRRRFPRFVLGPSVTEKQLDRFPSGGQEGTRCKWSGVGGVLQQLNGSRVEPRGQRDGNTNHTHYLIKSKPWGGAQEIYPHFSSFADSRSGHHLTPGFRPVIPPGCTHRTNGTETPLRVDTLSSSLIWSDLTPHPQPTIDIYKLSCPVPDIRRGSRRINLSTEPSTDVYNLPSEHIYLLRKSKTRKGLHITYLKEYWTTRQRLIQHIIKLY